MPDRTPAIADERPEHVGRVRALLTAAFGRPDEADLMAALHRDGDAVIALVAVDRGAVVGHVLFSRLSAPFPALGLGPVAVAPARQGAGLGSRLIRDGLARARQGGWEAVFVLGDPAYYRRFGFDAALAAGFGSPYAGPHLQALALGPALPARTGRIAYPPAFARLPALGG